LGEGKFEGSWGRKSPEGSRGGSPVGVGAKPLEPETHDTNFALRITLVNAYRPFYSSYVVTFVI